MEHGEIRNHREETTYGPDQELVNTVTGETIYTGPLSAVTETVEDRYCSICDKWTEVRGIIGQLIGCPECGAPWNKAYIEHNYALCDCETGVEITAEKMLDREADRRNYHFRELGSTLLWILSE